MLQRRHHEAVALLERVTALQPSAEARYNRWSADALGNTAPSASKRLDLRPDAEALSSLNVLTAAGWLDEVKSYRRALGLRRIRRGRPNLGNLLHLNQTRGGHRCYRRALCCGCRS